MLETTIRADSTAAETGLPAAAAWRTLRPDTPEPRRVESVRLKHKTAVYRLYGVAEDGGAVVAKRCHAETAEVERLVYEEVLPAVGVPALRCLGLVREPAGVFCWLFLEDAGLEAYSPANADHRALAGRFLAALHRARIGQALRASLPDRSPGHYSRLIRLSRAAFQAHVDHPALAAGQAELLRTFVAWCDLMLARWEEMREFFEAWPGSVVHGDFVIKNLRLRSGAGGPELLVFDWEMAGWGVPAVDLAQFLGKAASPDLETYRSGLRGSLPSPAPKALARLAAYGNLLRLVDKVYWEAVTLQGPTYEFLERPITTLRQYEPQMAVVLGPIGWISP